MTIRLRHSAVACILSLALLVGCGSSGATVPDPVPVKGQVTFAKGKATKKMYLTFQPAQAGILPTGFELNEDGTFSGKAIPGKYTYYFTAEDPRAVAALRDIPKEYKEGKEDRIVEVTQTGADLKISIN